MDYEQLLQLLQNDPTLMDQLAQMSAYGDTAALNQQKYGLAHERSKTPTPQGREAGGMYIAANPLEFLASGIQRFRGEQGLQNAQAAQEGLIQGDVNARKQLGGAMSEAMRRARSTQEPTGFVEAPTLY